MEWLIGLLVIPILAFFLLNFNMLALSRLLFWLFALTTKISPVLTFGIVSVIIGIIIAIIIKRCVHGKREETAPDGITKDR